MNLLAMAINSDALSDSRDRYCGLHEKGGISHQMRDIGVALADSGVARDVKSQQATESGHQGQTNGRDLRCVSPSCCHLD